MTHEERLSLIDAIKGLLPSVNHTRWPSGCCVECCTGCKLQHQITVLLSLLLSDVKLAMQNTEELEQHSLTAKG